LGLFLLFFVIISYTFYVSDRITLIYPSLVFYCLEFGVFARIKFRWTTSMFLEILLYAKFIALSLNNTFSAWTNLIDPISENSTLFIFNLVIFFPTIFSVLVYSIFIEKDFLVRLKIVIPILLKVPSYLLKAIGKILAWVASSLNPFWAIPASYHTLTSTPKSVLAFFTLAIATVVLSSLSELFGSFVIAAIAVFAVTFLGVWIIGASKKLIQNFRIKRSDRRLVQNLEEFDGSRAQVARVLSLIHTSQYRREYLWRIEEESADRKWSDTLHNLVENPWPDGKRPNFGDDASTLLAQLDEKWLGLDH